MHHVTLRRASAHDCGQQSLGGERLQRAIHPYRVEFAAASSISRRIMRIRSPAESAGVMGVVDSAVTVAAVVLAAASGGTAASAVGCAGGDSRFLLFGLRPSAQAPRARCATANGDRSRRCPRPAASCWPHAFPMRRVARAPGRRRTPDQAIELDLSNAQSFCAKHKVGIHRLVSARRKGRTGTTANRKLHFVDHPALAMLDELDLQIRLPWLISATASFTRSFLNLRHSRRSPPGRLLSASVHYPTGLRLVTPPGLSR